MRSPEFVELLLEKRAKINAINKKGDTALHLAMRARSKKVVEVLLRLPKNNQLLYKPNDQVSGNKILFPQLNNKKLGHPKKVVEALLCLPENNHIIHNFNDI